MSVPQLLKNFYQFIFLSYLRFSLSTEKNNPWCLSLTCHVNLTPFPSLDMSPAKDQGAHRWGRVHGLPRWPSGKGSPANTGYSRDMSSIPGSKRSPGEGNGNPFQYSCLENCGQQRNLMGYSPWGCRESDVGLWSLSIFLHSDVSNLTSGSNISVTDLSPNSIQTGLQRIWTSKICI